MDSIFSNQLTGEMIRRWRAGERPLAEEFLARDPALNEDPEAVADLVYEEMCLRQEYGQEIPPEQFLQRFPRWRAQLELLFDCQRLLAPCPSAPRFPAPGESLGDFHLLAELGGGAHGRVFLASQNSLGDRHVVLKLTPREADEHLSLARLQHTHIVPLYSMREHQSLGIRALCMPYFGGTTLDRLLVALRPVPPAERTGRDLLNALDWTQTAAPNTSPGLAPARQAMAADTYERALCRIGVRLADALEYARERGLVHLDVKPSNVLLAADGQPLLLDFHLAREPIAPDDGCPSWLGGTVGYMSPEQQAALSAVRQGQNVPLPVDGRSDIYSLGVVLYEALGGCLPEPVGKPRPLYHRNSRVSVGLADVIGKCLANDPNDRYGRAADLAADLRRHLADYPLSGVHNRSLAERWRKWRRRRPHAFALAGMMLAVLTAAVAVGTGAAAHFVRETDRAYAALHDGQERLDRGDWDAAVESFERSLTVARAVPFQRELAGELDHRLAVARQSRASSESVWNAHELHGLIERIRTLSRIENMAPEALTDLAERCRTLWERRDKLVDRLSPSGAPTVEPGAREDLFDLAIIHADLHIRLAPPNRKEAARREARCVLVQAESLLGPSPVMTRERTLRATLGPEP